MTMNNKSFEVSEGKGSLQDDICGEDPGLLPDNDYLNETGVFQGGSTEELEV